MCFCRLLSSQPPFFGVLFGERGDAVLNLRIKKTALCCGAFLFLLLGSACSAQEAFDAYRAALELKRQEQGLSCEFESKITFPAGQGTSSLSYSGSLLSDGKEQGNTAMAVQMTVGGSTLNTNLYFTDGWCYVDTMGVKVKQPMEDTPLWELSVMEEAQLEEWNFTSSAEKLKSGSLLKATFPKDQLLPKAQDLLRGLFQKVEIDWGTDLQSVSDGEMQFYLDEKGNLSKQISRYSVEAVVEGETVVLSVETTLRFPDPGKDHEVRLPDDLDAYEVLIREEE